MSRKSLASHFHVSAQGFVGHLMGPVDFKGQICLDEGGDIISSFRVTTVDILDSKQYFSSSEIYRELWTTCKSLYLVKIVVIRKWRSYLCKSLSMKIMRSYFLNLVLPVHLHTPLVWLAILLAQRVDETRRSAETQWKPAACSGHGIQPSSGNVSYKWEQMSHITADARNAALDEEATIKSLNWVYVEILGEGWAGIAHIIASIQIFRKLSQGIQEL